MTNIQEGPAFRIVVDHLGQGIAMFDAAHKLVLSNALFQELLGLPDNMVRSQTELREMIAFLAERGDFGAGDSTELAQSRMAQIGDKSVGLTERPGHHGQHLEVRTDHLPDGGLVISYTDISSRIEAERELARVNQNLEARVRDRTQALTLLNSELERARAKADAANIGKTRFFWQRPVTTYCNPLKLRDFIHPP